MGQDRGSRVPWIGCLGSERRWAGSTRSPHSGLAGCGPFRTRGRPVPAPDGDPCPWRNPSLEKKPPPLVRKSIPWGEQTLEKLNLRKILRVGNKPESVQKMTHLDCLGASIFDEQESVDHSFNGSKLREVVIIDQKNHQFKSMKIIFYPKTRTSQRNEILSHERNLRVRRRWVVHTDIGRGRPRRAKSYFICEFRSPNPVQSEEARKNPKHKMHRPDTLQT